jgi:PAS domain S-box-containing protein
MEKEKRFGYPDLRKMVWFLILSFFFFSLIIGTGGYLFYLRQKQGLKADNSHNLEAIAQLKTNQITNWLKERKNDATLIFNSPFLAQGIKSLFENRDREETQKGLQKVMSSYLRAYDYQAILIFDRKGKVQFALPQGQDSVDVFERELVKQAMKRRALVSSDLYRSSKSKKVFLDFYVPFFFDQNSERVLLGVTLLRIDPSQFLFPLIQTWPTPSATGETILVRPEGKRVLFLNELRHRKETALTFQLPGGPKDPPSVLAIQGRTGVIEGIDYRKISVLAALRKVPGTSWFIIAKIDQDEIYGPLRQQAWLLVILTGSLILVTGLGLSIYWRNQQLAFQKERRELLQREREQLEVTLRSIGDGVITTDTQGKVVLINTVAEILTGWSQKEAAGQSLPTVFRAINEQTRQEGENMVEKVLETRQIIDLANHSVLISRDGAEYQIADSAAPIFDMKGGVIGVVLVFRDVTQEYRMQERLRESEQRFKNAFEYSAIGMALVSPEGQWLKVNPTGCSILGYSEAELLRKTFRDITHPDDLEKELNFVRQMLAGEIETYKMEKRYFHKEGRIVWALLAVSLVKDHEGVPLYFIAQIEDITARKQAENKLLEWQDLMQYIIRYDPNAIGVFDKDLRYIFVSERYLNDYGIQDQNVIGRHHYEVIPEIPERWKQIHQRVLAGAIERSEEDSFVRLDGSVNYNRWECRPWYKSDGTIGGMILYTEVITERKRAEEALRQSEEKYRKLVEFSSDWIWEVNAAGVYIYVSPQVEKILGYEPQEVIGKTPLDFMPPEEGARVIEIVKKFAEAREPIVALENINLHKDGRRIVLETNGIPVLDNAGEVIGWRGVDRDITERKQVEESLRANENLLSSIFRVTPVGIGVVKNRILILVNDYMCRISGYSREELIGKSTRIAYLNDADFDYVGTESYRQLLAHGSGTVETRWRSKEGRVYEVLLNFAPLNIQDPSAGVTFIALDITDNKRAQERILQDNRELQVLSRSVQAVNSVLEIPVILRKLVASAIELTKAQSGVAGLMVDESLVFSEYNQRGQIIPINYHFGQNDGVPGYVMQTRSPYFTNDAVHDPHVIPEHQQSFDIQTLADVPILNRDGRILGCIEVHNKIDGPFNPSDIDMMNGLAASAAIAIENTQLLLARKRAEEEIRTLNAELEQRVSDRTAELVMANRELEAFSYSVSHDLRAPLRSINGFCTILQEQYFNQIDAQGRDYLQRVVVASRHMSQLIDDILRLSQISRVEIYRVQVNLSEMVQNIAAELQQSQPDRSAEFIIQPDLIVKADESLIRIALQNLVSNAWKFTGKVSPAKIEFGVTEIEGEKVFYVRDNGAGFNMTYAEKLFGVFQRLHSLDEFEGTGIGLAIVQRIIRRHGGRIWATGEVKKGASFYFTLAE